MRLRPALLVAALGAAVLAPAARADVHSPAPVTSGLPDDIPAAALKAEPTLPAPAGWPAPEAFPRTSGTGRMTGGALLWTDWIYDDHGAGAVPEADGNQAEAGSPAFGDYRYPDGPAAANGADIFRAGVAVTRTDTVWRVDWNTLIDPAVPAAEWALDTDANPSTGASAWPLATGRISSPGIDRALIVTSAGARLVDATTSATIATLPVQVDTKARSFVVHVPRTTLPVAGTWTVRLAAGLRNSAGNLGDVTNVTFRTLAQEPSANNYWNDMTQATTLLTGDVSAFKTPVNWNALLAHTVTPEATPRGWSDRWYVSSIEPGQGRRTDAAALNDRKPTYLGRVQPYAVYVPAGYDGTHALPLTFLLHSLTQNHNQYAGTTPNLSRDACENRTSICVTTLGRGPSGFYENEAQLDFWEVWARVAGTYRLDPERTILAGYSMGGIGSNHLAQAHPDLYAAAILLAGASGGNTPSLDNLRWVPTYLAGGAEDELVPVTDTKAIADGLDARGYRYRWALYPAEDHVAFQLQDGFTDAVAYMQHRVRTTDPARITFRWSPTADRPTLGFGTTGAYWLRDLTARDGAKDAAIDATSHGRPDPSITPVRSHDVLVPGNPTPSIITQLDWKLRPAGEVRRPAISLQLVNAASLTVRLADAGIRPGEHVALDVTTDGPVRLRLLGADGKAIVVDVPAGTSHIVR